MNALNSMNTTNALSHSDILQGLQSPWARLSKDRAVEPALLGDVRAKFVIVGAGFAGLSLAYHLSKKHLGSDIVVVEAGPVGAGASGRNSGMVGPGVWGPFHRMENRFGASKAAAMFRHTTEAVDCVIRLIQQEQLDCDLVIGSQYRTALTDKQTQSLAQEHGALQRAGFDVGFLTRPQIQARVGSDRYLSALQYPRTATVNPLKLARALADCVAQRGVRVYAHTAVTQLIPGPCVKLITANGSVTADHVMLATNGYASLLGQLKQRVIPMTTQMILSKPLTPEQLQGIGLSTQTAIIDSRRLFSFYRLTPDHRLVFGGGRAAYAPFTTGLAGAFKNPVCQNALGGLVQDLHDTFAGLKSTEIDCFWSGTMGFTIDNLPVVGRVEEPNIDFCGAWCGHGLALSIAAGERLACKYTASESIFDATLAWDRKSSPLLPQPTILKPGLKAYVGALAAMDHIGLEWQRFKNSHRTTRIAHHV